MKIRAEQPADHSKIHHLTKIAFEPKAFSDGTEPDLIDELRNAGELSLSLVAENGADIVGHITFSKVVIGQFNYGWYGLGPISVHPDQQRTGIGTSLIENGFQLLQDLGCEGCALVGDPKYYSRFGFVSDGKVFYKDTPSEVVQWKSFGNLVPVGELVFHPAFSG